jgi:hypothetical protein
MSVCKNNPKRTYTGKEPSPKGLGYCASGEKEGTKMEGKDGSMWIKKKGRWIKYNICDDFVGYSIPVRKSVVRLLYGIKSNKEGYIHKYISYNNFEKKLTKVPSKAQLEKLDKNKTNKYFCGNKLLPKDIKPSDIHKGCKKYMIHDNGGRPFLVCIKGKDALIYKVPDDVYKYSENIKDYHYSKLIGKYHFDKVFIPKGYDGPVLTLRKKFMSADKNDGNSVLLQLKDKYVYIGDRIYEFKTKDDIVKYYSPIGNNDVPYPVAVSKENIYFMLDETYVPIKNIKDFDKWKEIDLADAYQYYYGHSGEEALRKYAKKMIGVKTIEKRQW